MAHCAGIGIICKTPKSGVSKTRLHGVLGSEAAAELAGCCLTDVADSIASIPGTIGVRGYAVFSPEGSETELRRFLPENFELICRRDATLGVVLLGATQALLDLGNDCAVLVNADSPTLPRALLEQTIEKLRAPGDRMILGPAIDGGYYLIGLKQAHARVYQDIAWSTSAVLQTTIVRAGEIGLPVEVLSPWYDIDDAASLQTLVDDVQRDIRPEDCGTLASGPARATRKFLARHPELDGRLALALASAR
jgi:uncharacterized protein